jgi:DNA-directed RNA polymerase subunit N (RpoN/RPB10)
MSAPVCFSCGTVNKWDEYYLKLDKLLNDAFNEGANIKDIDVYVNVEKAVLDDLGVTRFCCRRMYHGDQRILSEINKLYK